MKQETPVGLSELEHFNLKHRPLLGPLIYGVTDEEGRTPFAESLPDGYTFH